jgi:gliding motility-associated-like protein
MLPSSITMPANQTDTSLDIIPIVDNLPEGIEYLKIYLLAPCNASTRVDSLEIQIRDFDILDITPDTLITCKGSTIQLNASAGYTTYTWDADPTLSSTTINNPIATPIASQTTYSCTADLLNCHARDSAFIQLKTVQLLSQQNVNCKDSSTGQIIVSHDTNWVQPVQYSINGGVFQSDSIFNNLPVGPYTIRVKDANCIDSVTAFILQDYPQLLATSTPVAATCSGNADGSITINANGGGNPYLYSIDDGVTYQSANLFAVKKGTYKIKVKDNNSCTTASQTVIVDLNNTVTVDAGQNEIICEGKGIQLNAVSNATSFSWTPIATLTNGNSQTPIAMPKITTKYYVTATQGICNNIDSLIVNVNPTPKADAGGDVNICFGANAQLFGAGGIEYTWTPSTYLNNSKAQSPTSIKPLKSIDYYLKVKDAKGCESINFDTVSIIVTPAIKIFAGNDTMVAINQPVQLHAVEVGTNKVTSYEWAPSYGLNNAAIAKPIATLDRDITYYVTGTTAIHCQGSDTINIKVYKGPEIYVPTAFTPNGDGRNDLLRPIAIGMKTYHYFRIYNRWGQIIFNTADFNKGWDGKINGITQDPGSYVWIAEAVDYKGNIIQQKGVSTIIR